VFNQAEIKNESFRNLILKMLDSNPENRITSAKVAQQLKPKTTTNEV
jgi:serine/threonine protein kinase